MERNKEIEDKVRDFYRAFSTGNVELMESTLTDSPETLMIGTNPNEWWKATTTSSAQ